MPTPNLEAQPTGNRFNPSLADLRNMGGKDIALYTGAVDRDGNPYEGRSQGRVYARFEVKDPNSEFYRQSRILSQSELRMYSNFLNGQEGEFARGQIAEIFRAHLDLLAHSLSAQFNAQQGRPSPEAQPTGNRHNPSSAPIYSAPAAAP